MKPVNTQNAWGSVNAYVCVCGGGGRGKALMIHTLFIDSLPPQLALSCVTKIGKKSCGVCLGRVVFRSAIFSPWKPEGQSATNYRWSE